MKVHFESIGLHNNAGISYPECYTAGNGPLDMDKTALKTSGHLENVNCLRCLRRFPKHYAWALSAKNRKILREKGILQSKLFLVKEDAELLSNESSRYPGVEEECAASGPNGLCCTRGENHEGAHVAHVEDHPVAMWVDVQIIEAETAAYRLKDIP